MRVPRVESFFTFFDQVNVQDPTMLFGKSGGGGVGGSGVNGPWAGGNEGWGGTQVLFYSLSPS